MYIEHHQAIQQAGINHYAHWNEALFEKLKKDCVDFLWQNIKQQKNAELIINGYLTLLGEGVGQRHILQSNKVEYYQWYKHDLHWNSFLEYLLLQKIPATLADIQPKKQLDWMILLWNIGENLQQGKEAWVELYCRSKTRKFDKIKDILPKLESLLTPLFTVPNVVVDWKTPFSLSIVDTSDVSDRFLPGSMHQVAPSVVCLHDRRDPHQYGGLFLGLEEMHLVTNHTCLGQWQGNEVKLDYHLKNAELIVNSLPSFSLPGLYHVQQSIATQNGMLIGSAVDSQRLWLVKTAL